MLPWSPVKPVELGPSDTGGDVGERRMGAAVDEAAMLIGRQDGPAQRRPKMRSRINASSGLS